MRTSSLDQSSVALSFQEGESLGGCSASALCVFCTYCILLELRLIGAFCQA